MCTPVRNSDDRQEAQRKARRRRTQRRHRLPQRQQQQRQLGAPDRVARRRRQPRHVALAHRRVADPDQHRRQHEVVDQVLPQIQLNGAEPQTERLDRAADRTVRGLAPYSAARAPVEGQRWRLARSPPRAVRALFRSAAAPQRSARRRRERTCPSGTDSRTGSRCTASDFRSRRYSAPPTAPSPALSRRRAVRRPPARASDQHGQATSTTSANTTAIARYSERR